VLVRNVWVCDVRAGDGLVGGVSDEPLSLMKLMKQMLQGLGFNHLPTLSSHIVLDCRLTWDGFETTLHNRYLTRHNLSEKTVGEDGSQLERVFIID
jgi:hypothetical protein